MNNPVNTFVLDKVLSYENTGERGVQSKLVETYEELYGEPAPELYEEFILKIKKALDDMKGYQELLQVFDFYQVPSTDECLTQTIELFIYEQEAFTQDWTTNSLPFSTDYQLLIGENIAKKLSNKLWLLYADNTQQKITYDICLDEMAPLLRSYVKYRNPDIGFLSKDDAVVKRVEEVLNPYMFSPGLPREAFMVKLATNTVCYIVSYQSIYCNCQISKMLQLQRIKFKEFFHELELFDFMADNEHRFFIFITRQPVETYHKIADFLTCFDIVKRHRCNECGEYWCYCHLDV